MCRTIKFRIASGPHTTTCRVRERTVNNRPNQPNVKNQCHRPLPLALSTWLPTRPPDVTGRSEWQYRKCRTNKLFLLVTNAAIRRRVESGCHHRLMVKKHSAAIDCPQVWSITSERFDWISFQLDSPPFPGVIMEKATKTDGGMRSARVR